MRTGNPEGIKVNILRKLSNQGKSLNVHKMSKTGMSWSLREMGASWVIQAWPLKVCRFSFITTGRPMSALF